VFDVMPDPQDQGALTLTARRVSAPYRKDYDEMPGEGPLAWGRTFDLTNWAFFSAFADGVRAGGAAVAARSPDLDILEGRGDLALLWDLRVTPGLRGRGIGTALFRAAAEWATASGCRELKVETQNINVPACRFYARQSCVLRAARRGAYPALPDEIQLLWYKSLAG
jgi:GNAT superfamily N-acetyltransferase